MGIAIDTFGQYAGKAYEGQINDLSMADVTIVVASVAIPFARAVVSAAVDKQGALPAAGAGFSQGEIEEDRMRATRLVEAAVSDGTEFDIDAYRLKSALAMENEDGD